MSLFDEVATTSTSVRLAGRDAAGEISSPVPGVFRIRIAPKARATSPRFPELPPKTSFACEPLAAQPLEVVRDGDVLVIEELRFDLATGAWSFAGAAGGTYDGAAQAGFPLDRHRARMELVATEGEAYLGFGEKVGPDRQARAPLRVLEHGRVSAGAAHGSALRLHPVLRRRRQRSRVGVLSRRDDALHGGRRAREPLADRVGRRRPRARRVRDRGADPDRRAPALPRAHRRAVRAAALVRSARSSRAGDTARPTRSAMSSGRTGRIACRST